MKGECDVVNMGTLYKCVQGCVRVCEGVSVPRGTTIWSTRPSFFALSALTFFPVRAMSRASGRPTFRCGVWCVVCVCVCMCVCVCGGGGGGGR